MGEKQWKDRGEIKNLFNSEKSFLDLCRGYKISENTTKEQVTYDNQNIEENYPNQYIIYKNIEANNVHLKQILGRSYDIVFREYKMLNNEETKVFICFVNSLVNLNIINQYIVNPLTQNLMKKDYDTCKIPSNIFKIINDNILSIADSKETQSMDTVITEVLSGNTALFIDGYDKAFIMKTQGYEVRKIDEPGTERVVRGPREGFIEDLRTNISMLRRKIKSSRLILETLTIGKQTQTLISIAYIDGIANLQIVEQVKSRLNAIDTDSILESCYIEEFIRDHQFSLFPNIGNSESPDVVAAKLLEGRVAIFCDGTPFVLTVPFLFIENLQNREDYYSLPFLSSFIRLMRYLSLFLTVTAPALYVALTTFHYEMVPTVLLINMASSREGIPFPAFYETIIISIIFEILREASIRMPSAVGTSISIVGTLVIGEAAVRAGIMSNPIVIVMAITAITSYACTPLVTVNIIIRFLFIFLASILGIYGILIGYFLLLARMCSLKSFGVNYLTPIAPANWSELKDTFIRIPLKLMNKRPHLADDNNLNRQKSKSKSSEDNSNKGAS